MLQLSRRRRVSDSLVIDMDAGGDVYIAIESDGEAMTYKLSKSDMRRVVAELRFFLQPLPSEKETE